MPDEHQMTWALRLLSQHGDMLQRVIEALGWRTKPDIADNSENAMLRLLALAGGDKGDVDQSEQILTEIASALGTPRVETDAQSRFTSAFRDPEAAELMKEAMLSGRVDAEEFDRIVDKLADLAKARHRVLEAKRQSEAIKVTREEILQVAEGVEVHKSIITRLDNTLQSSDLRTLLVKKNLPLPTVDSGGAYVREHLRGVLEVISQPDSTPIHGLGEGSATRKLLEALAKGDDRK